MEHASSATISINTRREQGEIEESATPLQLMGRETPVTKNKEKFYGD